MNTLNPVMTRMGDKIHYRIGTSSRTICGSSLVRGRKPINDKELSVNCERCIAIAPLFKPPQQEAPAPAVCPRCNGSGVLAVRGDDDTPCPECNTFADADIPFAGGVAAQPAPHRYAKVLAGSVKIGDTVHFLAGDAIVTTVERVNAWTVRLTFTDGSMVTFGNKYELLCRADNNDNAVEVAAQHGHITKIRAERPVAPMSYDGETAYSAKPLQDARTLEAALREKDARIAVLEAEVKAMQAYITRLQGK